LRNFIVILGIIFHVSFLSAQKNISGLIVDKETKEPISYAHLIIPSEKSGTTSDANGKFEFTVPDDWIGKELRITCVGFEDTILLLKQEKNLVISMKPSLEFLDSVHISHKERQKRKRVNSFRGKRSIGLGNFSGGAYPSMFARYYPFIKKLGDENYVEEITVFFYPAGRRDAKFRLRVLSSTAGKIPDEDLVDPILVDVKYRQGRVKIKMPSNGIEVPKEGFFIVIEHLFIKENLVQDIVEMQINDTLYVERIKQKRYAPIFSGVVEKIGESHSYYMSVNGWKKVEKLKMPKRDYGDNIIVAPAFKVKITN
jgi:hypothetical protein